MKKKSTKTKSLPLEEGQLKRLEEATRRLEQISKKFVQPEKPLRIINPSTRGNWCDSTCLELAPLSVE